MIAILGAVFGLSLVLAFLLSRIHPTGYEFQWHNVGAAVDFPYLHSGVFAGVQFIAHRGHISIAVDAVVYSVSIYADFPTFDGGTHLLHV